MKYLFGTFIGHTVQTYRKPRTYYQLANTWPFIILHTNMYKFESNK